jgi:hypothetical protein
MAREGKRVGGERKQVPVRFTTGEFTDRWTQHGQQLFIKLLLS